MTRTKMSISVIICTTAYLATSLLLGDRPQSGGGWVAFALGGAIFALLFTAGLLLVRRFARR